MPNFCERRCLPQAFFRGIWRSPENVGSAMVTGDAGAASTAAAPCHPGTAFMRHGLAGLPAAPAPSPSALASADAEKLRGFMSKVQKWGFGSAAELTDRWAHKESERPIQCSHCVYTWATYMIIFLPKQGQKATAILIEVYWDRNQNSVLLALPKVTNDPSVVTGNRHCSARATSHRWTVQGKTQFLFCIYLSISSLS